MGTLDSNISIIANFIAKAKYFLRFYNDMSYNKRNGNNGKEEISFSVGKEGFKEIEAASESRNLSIEQFSKEAAIHSAHKTQAFDILVDECQSGERINPESRLCQKVLDRKASHLDH
jgi:hypothetical protein